MPARHQSMSAELSHEQPKRHVMAFIRQAVYRRDGERCVECGQQDGLTLDHLVAAQDGGSDTMSNLRVVCRTCRKPAA